MRLSLKPLVFNLTYANDVENAFVPELWANESLAILVENMVAGNLVYRDFENTLQKYGDTVNVAKPAELLAHRKDTNDDVTVQDAIAANVQVKLDQHIHCSIIIRDGEESKSFKSLVDEFLRPQIIAQAKIIDQIVLGQYTQFFSNTYGALGGLTTSTAKQYLLGARQIMNINKAPVNGRNMVLNPVSETTMLTLDIFTSANQVGDDGTALRNASLGKKLGWDFYMDQNMAMVNAGNTTSTGAVSGNTAAGATTINLTGVTGIIATGTWLTIAGEMQPHQVVSHTETLGNTTQIVLDRGLAAAVVNTAVVTFYTPAQVNQSVTPTGYPAGWQKPIIIDTTSVAPQPGQAVSFGVTAGAPIYTIIRSSLTSILLDRPLEAAIADNAAVNIGPAGQYNFGFHRNAIALVVRPLAPPKPGSGANSAVANWNNLSMRVVITYDGNKQGHLVTVDMLAGVKVLDKALGVVMVG